MNTSLNKSVDENTSPVPTGNMSNMMKNWLSKAPATKKTPDSSAPIKPIDNNNQKLAEKKKDDEKAKTDIKSLEKFEKKTSSKVETKQTKTEKTSPPKAETKPKPKPKAKVSDEEVSPVEPKPKAKKAASAAAEKKDTTTTPKEKKPGNKFYAAYMHRGGPKNPGSKPIPIGKKDCFNNMKFLITGVMDSLERDECKNIIEKYGGSVVSGVTKKLDYLIVGEDAGQSKLEKANELNIKQLNEDDFLQLIITKSGIKNPEYEKTDVEMIDLAESDEEEKPKEDEKKAKKLKVLSESFDLDDDTVKPKESPKKPTPKKTEKTTPIKSEKVEPNKNKSPEKMQSKRY